MRDEYKDEIVRDINKKTALIFSLADIQEELVVDIISRLSKNNLYNFDVKHAINNMQRQTAKFRAALNNAYKNVPEKKEIFGEVTDELKDIIFKALKI